MPKLAAEPNSKFSTECINRITTVQTMLFCLVSHPGMMRRGHQVTAPSHPTPTLWLRSPRDTICGLYSLGFGSRPWGLCSNPSPSPFQTLPTHLFAVPHQLLVGRNSQLQEGAQSSQTITLFVPAFHTFTS